jgi:hypothetical protein
MLRKTTTQRLTSIQEVMTLWKEGFITTARAMMMVHGLASAHIHDILMAKVEEPTFNLTDIKDIEWKKIEVQQINRDR